MYKIIKSLTSNGSRNLLLAMAFSIAVFGVAFASPQSVSAACTAPSAPYGSVSYTSNVTQAGTYRIAVRLKAPTTTDNFLAIDVGNNCNIKYQLAGSDNVANTWKWISYKDGNSASVVNLNLTAGNNVINLYGTAPGVQVDRVLLMSDTACLPTGTGDNCYTPPDTTPPTVSLTAPQAGSTVQGTAATVSANATDAQGISKVEFYSGTTLIGSDTTSPYSASWNTTTTVDGPYSLTAKAFDTSNNSTTSSAISVKVTNTPPPPTPDTEPPSTPANLQATLATGTTTPQANLTWTASTDNVGVKSYDVYKGTTLLKTVTTNATTDSGLTIGQTYSYYVIAKDAVGNASAKSNTASISIPDSVIPTVSITSPSAGTTVSGTVNVAATAGDNIGVAKVQFLVDGVVQSPADTSAPYAFSWNTTALGNGAHTIAAQSYDAAGNKSLVDSKSVTVQNGDTTPPSAPGNFKAVASAYNKVVLTWTAATDASGIKDYLLSRDGVWVGLMGANTTTYTDTNVTATTKYSYELIAIDNADNLNSATTSVTTPDAPDSQAPSAPANLTATAVSTTQINLSWQASTDNIGVKNYEVYRGSTKVATVTTTSFGDTGLSPDTSYSYTVKAVDAAGNSSADSNTATVKTPAPPVTSTNVALNKPATVSSVESTNYSASRAVDGDAGTRWASALKSDGSGGSDPEWIYVDLGSSYDVSGVKLNWEAAYGKAYQVQVSTDASSWQSIYNTTSGDGGVDDLTGLTGSGRYVRMYGTARGTKWGYSLLEMEIYGKPSNVTPPPPPPPPILLNGDVYGQVRDSSTQKTLGSVYVSIYYSGSTHRVKTSSTGNYRMTGVPAGTYSFKYVRTNYITLNSDGTIPSGSTLTKNITMVHK